jgi:hypothetical protein
MQCNRRGVTCFKVAIRQKIIDSDEPEYFRRVSDYIHLNPAAAGLVGGSAAKPRASYTWSSYPLYLMTPSQRPDWLSVDWVLEHQGLPDTMQGRRRYRERMEDCAHAACRDPDGYMESEENRGIERGWVHGSKAFRQQMVDWLGKAEGPGRRGVYDAL